MLVELRVQRLFCDSSCCERKTFAEQVPGLTVAYARRTPLLRAMVERVPLALGGRPGGRSRRVRNGRRLRLTRPSHSVDQFPSPPWTAQSALMRHCLVVSSLPCQHLATTRSRRPGSARRLPLATEQTAGAQRLSGNTRNWHSEG